MADFLRLQAYRDLNELAELRPSWDELLSEYPLSSTFSTWEWLASWWEAFGKNQRLLVLAAFDPASRLIGLAPLSISLQPFGRFLLLRVLRLMGDGSGDSDNLDLPVRPGFENDFAEAIARYLQQQKHEWDVCHLNTTPPNSPVACCLTAFLKASGWIVCEYSRICSAIPLPETWEEYLRRISNEDQKNLTRYTRRLGKRYRVRIYRIRSEKELPACLERLFTLHQGRWQNEGQPGTFSSMDRREFYFRLSQRLLTRDWLELWVLELDDQVVAVQFALRYKEQVFQLQEGYDHRLSSDRAGYVLRGEVIKRLISEKVRVYDFLGGEDAYKARWGAQVGTYRDLQFARPLSLGGVILAGTARAVRVKAWLRRKLPHSAWGVLNRINKAIHGKREPDSPISSGDRSSHKE